MKRTASAAIFVDDDSRSKAARNASYVRDTTLAFASLQLSPEAQREFHQRTGAVASGFSGLGMDVEDYAQEQHQEQPFMFNKRKVSPLVQDAVEEEWRAMPRAKKMKKEVVPPAARWSVVPTDKQKPETKHTQQQVLFVDAEWPLFTLEGSSRPGQFVVDLKGQLLSVNRAFCEWTGYSEEHLLGSSCLHLLHHDDRNWVLRSLRDVATRTEAVRMRPRLVCLGNGTTRARPFHMEVFMLDDGETKNGETKKLGGFIVPMSADERVERHRTPLIEWQPSGKDDDDDNVVVDTETLVEEEEDDDDEEKNDDVMELEDDEF